MNERAAAARGWQRLCRLPAPQPLPPALLRPAAGPRALAYNPAENAVLVQTDVEGGTYELYALPKDAAGREVAPVRLAGWLAGWLGTNFWLCPLRCRECWGGAPTRLLLRQ